MLFRSANQTEWISAKDGAWSFETAIELPENIINRIANDEYVYINVAYSNNSAGERSVFDNKVSSISSLWNINLLNRFTFNIKK